MMLEYMDHRHKMGKYMATSGGRRYSYSLVRFTGTTLEMRLNFGTNLDPSLFPHNFYSSIILIILMDQLMYYVPIMMLLEHISAFSM